MDPVLFKPYLYFPLCVSPVFLDLHRHRSLPFVYCTPIRVSSVTVLITERPGLVPSPSECPVGVYRDSHFVCEGI